MSQLPFSIPPEQPKEPAPTLSLFEGAEAPESQDLANRFLDAEFEIKAIEETLSQAKSRKSKLEKEIVDSWMQSGTLNVKTSRGTVYLHSTLGVSAKDDRESVLDALRAVGLDQYIDTEPRWNTQSVAAYVREQRRNGEPIPKALEDSLKIQDLCFVRVRKS